jgi:hypothetical protein
MEKTSNLSGLYRVMIYFAHTTLCIYSKDIHINESMSIEGFRSKNKELIQRVCDESISIFNYELSHEQMTRAIQVFFITKYNPSSVFETEIYQL